MRLVGEPRRPLFGWQLHLRGQRAIDKLVGGQHSGLKGIKRAMKEAYICTDSAILVGISRGFSAPSG